MFNQKKADEMKKSFDEEDKVINEPSIADYEKRLMDEIRTINSLTSAIIEGDKFPTEKYSKQAMWLMLINFDNYKRDFAHIAQLLKDATAKAGEGSKKERNKMQTLLTAASLPANNS